MPSLKASQLPEELLETYEEAFYLLDHDEKGIIGKYYYYFLTLYSENSYYSIE